MKECWYYAVCSKTKTDDCNEHCIRHMEMKFLMDNSNIPLKKQRPIPLTPCEQDIDAFLTLKEIKDNIVEFVNEGKNLYIHSDNFGNGKTSWSIKLLQKYFDEIWAGNGFNCRGIFIHVPTLLSKFKDNISTKDTEFELIRTRLMNVDIVVWDDIASTKLSDYDHANLLTYIDTRLLKGLSNIYTGNLHGTELTYALGNRLSSRVWNDSQKVSFVGIDRRGC